MNVKSTNGALKTNGGDGQTKTEPYSGGTLRVEVYKEDTQKDFVWRGLYKHAEAAGLPHAEAVKYADAWAQDKLMHQEGDKTKAYTAKEFTELKREGASDFDLNEQYSPQALNDLRQRQMAYQASLQNEPTVPPSEMPSISAPQYNNAEKAVNWLTHTITSATGTDNENGKQFNRLSVSTLHLLGQVGEIENAAMEKVSDAIRSVAPESVDNILNKVDQTNRENAQALKNANTTVTNNDRMEDVWAAKNGITRPLAEDLHRKFMYFPEGIPNAVDSAIKGDFKEDDGSYSDKVGKIVGGLNPAGDIRDIIANGKGVIEGKNGAWIGLGASIVGAIPIIGDGGKIVMKAEKEVIAETVEKLVKQGVEKETAEKLAKEEVGKLVKEAEAKIAKDEVKTEEIKNVSNIAKGDFKEVEIVDKMGNPVGEFDKIEKGLFVEDKSAKGLSTLHPKTGKPLQTAEQWAEKQIYEKSVVRIENLENKATSTRATKGGSQVVPSLDEIKNIRKLQFRVEGDSIELRKAVEEQIKRLSQKYPDWEFSAKFGG